MFWKNYWPTKYLGLWCPGLRNFFWKICKTLCPPTTNKTRKFWKGNLQKIVFLWQTRGRINWNIITKNHINIYDSLLQKEQFWIGTLVIQRKGLNGPMNAGEQIVFKRKSFSVVYGNQLIDLKYKSTHWFHYSREHCD